MPIIYETTAKISEKGHLIVDIDDLPFEKGTDFLVKLIPQIPCKPEVFKQRMETFIEKCSKNNPYAGMSKDQIITELRRQREEMYNENSEN